MVYQQFINYPSLTVYENIASPLRVRGRDARRRSTARVQEAAELLKLDAYLDAHAAAAVRRPAAAHRDRPRAGQGRRAGAARRAARQPRLQAARGTARRNCRASSRPPARSSSMPPPSRRRRCCSAATPPRCAEGRVTQFGADASRSTASRTTLRDGAGLLRSAAQHRSASRRTAARCMLGTAAVDAPAAGRLARPAGRRLSRRLPAASAGRSSGRTAAMPSQATVDGDRDHRLGELRASRRRGATAGSRWLHGVHDLRARRRSSTRLPRSATRLRLRRGRPPASPRRTRGVREATHGPH